MPANLYFLFVYLLRVAVCRWVTGSFHSGTRRLMRIFNKLKWTRWRENLLFNQILEKWIKTHNSPSHIYFMYATCFQIKKSRQTDRITRTRTYPYTSCAADICGIPLKYRLHDQNTAGDYEHKIPIASHKTARYVAYRWAAIFPFSPIAVI